MFMRLAAALAVAAGAAGVGVFAYAPAPRPPAPGRAAPERPAAPRASPSAEDLAWEQSRAAAPREWAEFCTYKRAAELRHGPLGRSSAPDLDLDPVGRKLQLLGWRGQKRFANTRGWAHKFDPDRDPRYTDDLVCAAVLAADSANRNDPDTLRELGTVPELPAPRPLRSAPELASR